LQRLGLRPAKAETQILQRDRIATIGSVLAVAAGSIEQMFRTFWELMRSEVRELREPKPSSQRSSSSMAHKWNPNRTERETGQSRLVRGYAGTLLENIATPEWREISQSSVERIVLPDMTTLLHFMASDGVDLVENLVVFEERMRHTLEVRTCGVWAGQQVRIALMEAGVPYSTAYEYVQATSFEAVDSDRHLSEVLSEKQVHGTGKTAQEILGEEALATFFDARRYIEEGINHLFAPLEAAA
jgi:adenylosuccinate lyase